MALQKFAPTGMARATAFLPRHFGATPEESIIPTDFGSPHQRPLPSEKFSAALELAMATASGLGLALRLVSASESVLDLV